MEKVNQVAQVGDIINIRFSRFKDGAIDTNIRGHRALVIDVNEDKIKYVLLSSKKHKHENKDYAVELSKKQIECNRLEAPITYVRTDVTYETNKRLDIIGYVTNESIVHHIIRKAAYFEREEKRRVIASKKKYKNNSVKKHYKF